MQGPRPGDANRETTIFEVIEMKAETIFAEEMPAYATAVGAEYRHLRERDIKSPDYPTIYLKDTAFRTVDSHFI
jgi:hypothetical protein